jgi:hypothetical protein
MEMVQRTSERHEIEDATKLSDAGDFSDMMHFWLIQDVEFDHV